ncbi:uncharacterized protein [Setaria viridis]|uniref:uncharacterized protein n=1 Tax=Setaria viridis TaxID=4556 RepID=UPI001493B76F|nr:uncharacterized protein LOC117863630 [Setaria viridis]
MSLASVFFVRRFRVIRSGAGSSGLCGAWASTLAAPSHSGGAPLHEHPWSSSFPSGSAPPWPAQAEGSGGTIGGRRRLSRASSPVQDGPSTRASTILFFPSPDPLLPGRRKQKTPAARLVAASSSPGLCRSGRFGPHPRTNLDHQPWYSELSSRQGWPGPAAPSPLPLPRVNGASSVVQAWSCSSCLAQSCWRRQHKARQIVLEQRVIDAASLKIQKVAEHSGRAVHLEPSTSATVSFCSQLLDLSGIFTVFFCGIVMSHYTWHNVTKSSRVTTKHAFATLSFIAEMFLFMYVGMDAFDIEKREFASNRCSSVMEPSLFEMLFSWPRRKPSASYFIDEIDAIGIKRFSSIFWRKKRMLVGQDYQAL